MSEFLPEQEIHSGEAIGLFYTVKLNPEHVDSCFGVLKVQYTDTLRTTGLMRLTMRLYPFIPNTVLMSPTPYDYNRIRQFPILQKLW
jgi:hypothetical protein